MNTLSASLFSIVQDKDCDIFSYLKNDLEIYIIIAIVQIELSFIHGEYSKILIL